MMSEPARRAMTPHDLAELAKTLGSPHRVAGGGWSCKCPAHNDHVASLSISLGDEDRLLAYCHAGCSWGAIWPAIKPHLERMGVRAGPPNNGRLKRGDLKTIQGNAKAQQPSGGRSMKVIEGGISKPIALGHMVKRYKYIDVTGALLFEVVRFEPKTFRQRRPDGSGWKWGLGQTKPILYRLPEVLAAEIVWIAEGEKDADNLRELGVIATTSPMGAGKWRQEYGEALAGKHVVILPDNDDAGRKHADDVATSAAKHDAASIRIVQLPGLPEKGDPSDWIAAGGSRKDLEALARETPLWGSETEGADPGWRNKLIEGDKGPTGGEANVLIALNNAPELAGRVRMDAFRTEVQFKNMPWDKRPEWRDWTDNDDVFFAAWLQERGIPVKTMVCAASTIAHASTNEHHPVRAYLRSLKWDKQKRIDGWLFEYLGAVADPDRPDEGNVYIQAVAAKFLISAVARVFRPGCQVDTALILEGEQGLGKSSILRELAGSEFFADEIAALGSKDAAQDMRGKWIIELSELAALKKSDVEPVKSFISRRVDHYRPSYARRSIDVPRQCVFTGSTNRDDYLRDDTGNRRFWPVKTSKRDVDGIIRDRDQLWAEAVHRFDQGCIWHLTKEEDRIAKIEQADRVERDAWADLIDDFLRTTTIKYLTVAEILNGIGIPRERWGSNEQSRILRHLRTNGYERKREPRCGDAPRKWGYKKEGEA